MVESVDAHVQEEEKMKTEANAVVVYPLGELAPYGVASQVARRIGDLAGTLMQQHPAPGQRHHDVVLGLPDKSNHTNPLPDASQSGSPRIHALFSNICSKCVFPRDIYDGCTRKESGLALGARTGTYRILGGVRVPWRYECAKTGSPKPNKPEQQNATDRMKCPSIDNMDRHVMMVTGTLSSKESKPMQRTATLPSFYPPNWR